jgi:threonine aldolase
MVRPLNGDHGVFTGAQLKAAIRPASRYTPKAAAVSVEQTSNLGGGRCWSLEEVRDVVSAASDAGLATHLDGARLFNAVVATGSTAREFASGFDSAWIDLTKGLGAPIGAVLTGSADFIADAWRLKQRWGGAMRQSGVLAAAGIYALQNHVARLSEDHDNAKALAHGISDHVGLVLDLATVQTNIVLWELRLAGIDATQFSAQLLDESGVRVSVMGAQTVRAVTHLGISRDDVSMAVASIRALLDRLRR